MSGGPEVGRRPVGPEVGRRLAYNRSLVLGGQDTCQGDSGGPLWVLQGGKAVLIGEKIAGN